MRLSIVGRIAGLAGGRQRDVHYIEVDNNGAKEIITTDDLIRLGYAVTRHTDCYIRIRYKNHHRPLHCYRPRAREDASEGRTRGIERPPTASPTVAENPYPNRWGGDAIR